MSETQPDYSIEIRKWPLEIANPDDYHLQFALRNEEGKVIDTINGLATDPKGNPIPIGSILGGDDKLKVYRQNPDATSAQLSTRIHDLPPKNGPRESFAMPKDQALARWDAGIKAGEAINGMDVTYAAVPIFSGANSNSVGATLARVMGFPHDGAFIRQNTPGSSIDLLPDLASPFQHLEASQSTPPVICQENPYPSEKNESRTVNTQNCVDTRKYGGMQRTGNLGFKESPVQTPVTHLQTAPPTRLPDSKLMTP